MATQYVSAKKVTCDKCGVSIRNRSKVQVVTLPQETVGRSTIEMSYDLCPTHRAEIQKLLGNYINGK